MLVDGAEAMCIPGGQQLLSKAGGAVRFWPATNSHEGGGAVPLGAACHALWRPAMWGCTALLAGSCWGVQPLLG